jgi:hypothetical protein
MRGATSQFVSLLATAEFPELGPGPRAGVRSIRDIQREVESISTDASEPNRELIYGTVLLWHDHLDASHEISQKIETQDGNYLHAIMHRREPDYSNAKYWFRRVGRHVCYAELAKYVLDKVAPQQPDLANKIAPNSAWDAFAFVDACEAASDKSQAAIMNLLREIQAAEIKTFLSHLIPTRAVDGG